MEKTYKYWAVGEPHPLYPRRRLCTCRKCERQIYILQSRIDRTLCICRDRRHKATLTINGETQSISIWASRYPEVNVASARARYYARKAGDARYADWTDVQILRGKDAASIGINREDRPPTTTLEGEILWVCAQALYNANESLIKEVKARLIPMYQSLMASQQPPPQMQTPLGAEYETSTGLTIRDLVEAGTPRDEILGILRAETFSSLEEKAQKLSPFFEEIVDSLGLAKVECYALLA